MSRKLTQGLAQEPAARITPVAAVGDPPLALVKGGLEPPLKKDAQLPFVELAWSPGKMLDFLNREVLPTRSVPQAVGLTRQRIAYTAGRKCVVLYSLSFSEEVQPARRAVVTFTRDDSLQDVYLRRYHRNSDGPLAGPVVYLPDYRCLVEFFPMDWKLPALPRAMDPREIARLLGRPDAPGADPGQPAPVEVLRYRPHEACVLAYRFGLADGAEEPQEVVGKLYWQEPRAEKVWHTLGALYSQAVEHGVGIPKPLALEKEWRFVLMERVPGISMKRLIEEAMTGDDPTALVKTAAAALAAFHRLQLDCDELRGFGTEMEKLRKRADRLHLVTPLLARKVNALLRRLEPHELRCRTDDLTAVHGDFKPNQLLNHRGRVSVVDFDRACRGDPAIDVGSFMAQLRKEALSLGQPRWRSLSPYFLAEYQERFPVKGLDYRARVFEVMSLVRIAVRKFEGSPQSCARKGLSSDQVQLLEEAASCLSAL